MAQTLQLSAQLLGQQDISLLHYLGNQERFADFFNGIVFRGKPIIEPSELEAMDTTFVTEGGRKKTKFGTTLVIFAVENQSEIDYTMPARIMEYQALDEDTYDIIAELLHEEQLLKVKQRSKTDGGKNDMCKAIQEWIADERAEERVISEARGEARGEAKIVGLIRKKCAKGLSAEETAEILEQTQEYVAHIMEIMETHREYSDEQVARELLQETPVQ